LIELQKDVVFKNFYLVGGTALALQLGHRRSVDIDLFTEKEIDREEIFGFLNKKYKGKVTVITSQKSIFQAVVNTIKVDIVSLPYKLIETVRKEAGIRYLGLKDISAMKLAAITNRGDQAKDFVDLYYLLKTIPLKDMFAHYKEKYSQKDVVAVKKSLVYFDDVPSESWTNVDMIKDALDIEKIKKTILDKVNKYNASLR
jgi:hypothetical protein